MSTRPYCRSKSIIEYDDGFSIGDDMIDDLANFMKSEGCEYSVFKDEFTGVTLPNWEIIPDELSKLIDHMKSMDPDKIVMGDWTVKELLSIFEDWYYTWENGEFTDDSFIYVDWF